MTKTRLLSFPYIESLKVEGYGLFPGPTGNGKFNVRFTAGPWIVLGVNGIGKTTLLLMLKHLLVGAKRSIPAGFRGEERPEIAAIDHRLFAMRVADGAATAKARLTCRFGKSRLTVERRLSDLSLVKASVQQNGRTQEIEDEDVYCGLLAELMGVLRFEDALRVLDKIIFTLEEDEPLIWDVAAQYEILRALLRPDISGELRRLESQIVSADSAARNLNAALYKVTKRRDEQIIKEKHAGDISARLAATNAELEIAQSSEAKRQRELEDADQWRSDIRIELKRSEHATDQATQAYEKIKYNVLRHAFAGVSPNEQYVFLKLVAERVCLACGRSAEEAATEIERRRGQSRCLVCGTKRKGGPTIMSTTEALQTEAEKSYAALERAHAAKDTAEQRSRQAQQRWVTAANDVEQARADVDGSEAKIRALQRKLPAAARNLLVREEDRIQLLRREVIRSRNKRDEAEESIAVFVDQLRSAAEAIRERINLLFRDRARPFFGDQVRLVYAPRKERIGQGGRAFDFPAFEVEMSSEGPHGDFVRRRSDQVSQSQREYLDTIFRMSLLETLGDTGYSLVFDGPERALDAVFAERAGDLFSAFAASRNRNVVLACNVVEGGLIPNALRKYTTKKDRMSRLVNLLEIALPTTTLLRLKNDYQEKVNAILRQSGRR